MATFQLFFSFQFRFLCPVKLLESFFNKANYKKFSTGLCAAPAQESLDQQREKHTYVPAQTLYDHLHNNKTTHLLTYSMEQSPS